MAEYWKSTPRYWCKYCSAYVRDTKLERQNHDATAKHQSAIKRSLRDLHRGKEREEREKERAKREVDRLNGIVSSAAGPSSSSSRDAGETERKRQVEQLASLGVSIPDQFRGDLAMAGEWTVTSTTIVPDKKNKDDDNPQDAIARGVHKRERTEEELKEEEAVKGLFKKPRRWGRDSKTIGTAAGGRGEEEEEDLDALLSGGLVVVKKTKEEDDQDKQGRHDAVVKEKGQDHLPSPPAPFKREPSDNDDDPPPIPDRLPALADDDDDKSAGPPPPVKTEHDGAEGGASAPAVVFKKRKPKNIRQK